MDFQPILTEVANKNDNSLYTASGIMLNNAFIITTGITPLLNTIQMKKNLILGQLRQLDVKNFYNIDINIVWKKKNNHKYNVKNAKPLAIFVCENIYKTGKYIFKDWSIDSIENNRNLNEILSVFFVLQIDFSHNINDFKKMLYNWWLLTYNINLKKTEELICISTSFGNRNFINSFSKGIISNIFGDHGCLFLSDCPTTPSSEGSPVYINRGYEPGTAPIGLVLSSLSWWRGEWTGLTLIADIRSFLGQLIETPVKFLFAAKSSIKHPNYKLLAISEFSLVQIYCGSNWGTAVLFDLKQGIFITNAHVVENHQLLGITLYWKTNKIDAQVVYKNDIKDNNILDIAIIKVINPQILSHLNLIAISDDGAPSFGNNVGDCVFSAGYALYPKESQILPTLSKGHISYIDEFTLKTTCSVHPGNSGGAILSLNGQIIGLIVGNTKLHENGKVYPRSNVAIRFKCIQQLIKKYLINNDASCFVHLQDMKRMNFVSSKL